MLVNRRTYIVKWGCMEEMVALFKAEIERINHPHAWHVYTSKFAPLSTMAMESEWESLEEYEKFWAEYYASPLAPEVARFLEKAYELADHPGGVNELWTRIE